MAIGAWARRWQARASQLKYLMYTGRYPLEHPVVIQYPINDICNSRCQMCSIWARDVDDAMAPERLAQALDSPLFKRVMVVGLNGGEPTLRKDIADIAAVLFKRLPALQVLSVITNGYHEQEVIERITAVGRVAQAQGGRLDLMVSLDGVGDLHDRVRRRPGNFAHALNVIRHFRGHPLIQSLRVGCTVIAENVYGVQELLEFCISEGVYVKFRLGVPHQRLYTGDKTGPYALTEAARYHFGEFLFGLAEHYEQDARQRYFYRSLAGQLLWGAPRLAGCDWQHRGVTISSRGELLYCAVKSPVIGQLGRDDPEQAYFGHEADLQKLLAEQCASCRHDYLGVLPRGAAIKQQLQRWMPIKADSGWGRSVLPLLKAGKRHLTQIGLRSRLRQRVVQASAQPQPWPQVGETGAYKVIICGWYGTETLGDKAILAGVIEALREALPATTLDVRVASLFPYVTEQTVQQMASLAGVGVISLETAAHWIHGADLLLLGGGPLMAVDEIASMEGLFTVARRCGVRTVVAGCGIGPLGRGWHRHSVRSLLAMADQIIVRDPPSAALAQSLLAAPSPPSVTEDPAFTWLARQAAVVPGGAVAAGPTLVLGLREFPYQQYAETLSHTACLAIKQRYEQVIGQLLEQLVERYPTLKILPLPMCTNHFGGDDRWFYRGVLRELPHLTPHLDLTLLGPELSPEHYRQAMGSGSALLAMRFHSLVFALGLGIPAVAIDYTLGRGKVAALAQQYEVPCISIAELTLEFLLAACIRQLTHAAERQAAEPLRFPTALKAAVTSASVEIAGR